MAVYEFECEPCIHGYQGPYSYCKGLAFFIASSDNNCCIFKLACAILHEGTDAAKDPLGSGK